MRRQAITGGAIALVLLFTGCAQILSRYNPDTEKLEDFIKAQPEYYYDPAGYDRPKPAPITMSAEPIKYAPGGAVMIEAEPKIKNRSSNVAKTSKPKNTQTQPTSEPLTAEWVPGSSDKVFSPYDPGKIVDVKGYTQGMMVLDPYSKKPFIVGSRAPEPGQPTDSVKPTAGTDPTPAPAPAPAPMTATPQEPVNNEN